MSGQETSNGARPVSERALSAVGGRRVIVGLGVLYLVLAVSYPVAPFADAPSVDLALVVEFLVGGPALVVLYVGYRLPGTDIRPELYATVARWCLGGIGVVLGVLLVTGLVSDLTNVVHNALILTALGSVAGLAAGIHDARAKSRALELRETVDQLRTSNERLEQFAYAASHDLQEPLRMVSSYLQLLETRYADDLDEDAQEYIEFAVDGADRMRSMTEGLLEYSRVSARGEPMETTDAEAVLEDVRDDLRLRIEETDATITADDLPTVTADPDQFAQVLRNLLLNALTYSGDRPPEVHVSAERDGDEWCFSVADSGIGIDPEFHDRVFEVFERLHAGEQSPDAGAGGIGLALCERIVERHGGEIWVDSEPGEGATFSFTLPTDGDTSE